MKHEMKVMRTQLAEFDETVKALELWELTVHMPFKADGYKRVVR